MSLFVGRQAELAVLRARQAEALAGQPRIVCLRGPAGIGKTTLIECFLREPGTTPAPVVLRAGAEETEQLLAYGVVEQLARSAADAGAGLRESLAGPDRVGDPVTVGTRILELLDRIEGATPVVLVVDDAHWADRPSLQALSFAVRRLVADPVLVLVAAREDRTTEPPESLRRLVSGHRGSELRLHGLDEEDLRELAAGMGVDAFGPAAAQRLRDGTRGNPLHARALLDEFPPDRWGQERQPLPSPRSFRLLVRDRYAGRDADTRALVDAAAVLGPHCPLPLAAALAGVDEALAAVDRAAACDLLHPDETGSPWTLGFPHPLVRAAVYDALGPARRHALHTAAAALLDQRDPADRGAVLRHRVAAALEPDEGLASDLTRFADAEARRQAWQSAAAHLHDAARLSPDPRQAQRRVLRAVVWTLLRGDGASAATFADQLAGFDAGPMRDAALGALATAADDPERAARLLAAAWARRGSAGAPGEPADTEVEATIALLTAIHCYGRLDAAATVEWCRRALAVTEPGTSMHAVAQTYLLHGLGYSGRTSESAAEAASADARPDDADHLWLNPRSARGVLRLVEDDLDGAAEDLATVAAAAAELGILNTAAFGLAYLARVEWVAGSWDSALVHAERAVAVNLESDFGFMQSAIVAIAVLVPAARGDWAAAEALVRTLSENPAGYERSTMAYGMAQARIGEARGNPAAVLTGLEPVRRFEYRDGADEPGFWPWQDLYAEALTGSGRFEEAAEFLVPHERAAHDRGRRSAIGRLARARGRVEAAAGRTEAAEAAFELALRVTDDLPAPFERARIELAAGGFLRRTGRRRRAADLLGEAERRFTALSARPYAERCAKELAASGLQPASRRGRDLAELTSQELVVARLVAEGRSNREVADELVVSVKTIEFHLRNVFQKLDVTSRRRLAAKIAELG
jgi:ATP/maltotriose-dependent transcriptional regulator MalT